MAKTSPENQKTRPDLDDQTFVVWTAAQPENRGIDVHAMYRKMLEWCMKKGLTPTRRRLLRWLDTERESLPMTYEPAYFKGDEPTAVDGVVLSPDTAQPDFKPDPPCEFCGKERCLQLHREERGI